MLRTNTKRLYEKSIFEKSHFSSKVALVGCLRVVGLGDDIGVGPCGGGVVSVWTCSQEV